jgi:hypothetical protein
MKEGDYLVGIGDADVKWSSHAEVTTIHSIQNNLPLSFFSFFKVTAS